MLVIGDVAGHDTEAAVTMGQLRGLLRGIATYSGAGPAEVLRGLDSSMEVLMVGHLATAAVVRFEQSPEEREQGTTRMVWSSAGPPARARAAGVIGNRPDDDVALIAVRLHPQDQPRPEEAGPQRVPDSVPDEPGE